jgi:uncharacterized membrane protein YcjF (UPF0283 family)
MAIPDDPSPPSRTDEGAPRSRLGRLVMAVFWGAAGVLCGAALVLAPGGLIVLALLVRRGEWVLALAMAAGLLVVVGAVRFVGRRLLSLSPRRRGAGRWDDHF